MHGHKRDKKRESREWSVHSELAVLQSIVYRALDMSKVESNNKVQNTIFTDAVVGYSTRRETHIGAALKIQARTNAVLTT